MRKMGKAKKILRYILITAAILIGCVLLFIAVSVIPVDRTPVEEKPFYSVMMKRLDSLREIQIPDNSKQFSVGFAKVSLTPSHPLATAGYGNRRGKAFSGIHDSIYVRSVVIDNGINRIAIVSADLLIIPPTVTEVLQRQLPGIGFTLDNTYLTATHTHNSIGNWGEGVAGFIYGEYDPSVVQFIADRITQSIVTATREMKSTRIATARIPFGEAVRNRIDGEGGQVDSLIRTIQFKRDDSSKLVLVSYTAHPTCLYSRDLELSRDYPGKLVDELEAKGYTFAMFLAGAVGSHGCNPPAYGWNCIDWMAEGITNKIISAPNTMLADDHTLAMQRIPLLLGEPQVKISEDWRLRPWLFRASFGEYTPYLSALRIGNIVMLGTPCDFSGELSAPIDALAEERGMHAIITSFNGHYIGYVTRDDRYDNPHYETRLMNWYGPGNGKYLTECLSEMLIGISD